MTRVLLRLGLYATLSYILFKGFNLFFDHLSTDASPFIINEATINRHSIGSLGKGIALRDGRQTVSRRTVAVADLHGDLEHALNVMRMASLVSTSSRSWIAGHDVLVSTGDIVDRGDDTIQLYQLFASLRSQSASVGGQVRNLIGNHEMMNALKDWRYVTQGDISSFGGAEKRREAMSVNGWIGQDWMNNFNVTTVESLLPEDHPGLPEGYTPPTVSFVHGGITPQYAERGVDGINRLGHSLLVKGLRAKNPDSRPPADATDEEKRLWGENGPLWYRGYAADDETKACKNAHEAMEHLGVRHLVMGHTPNLDGFVVRCSSSAILLIDTGISRAYGGEQSALVIDFELIPTETHEEHLEGKQLWKEVETLTALYKGRKPKVIDRLEQSLWL